MKTLYESLLGNIDDQVKEISGAAAIDAWIEKHIGPKKIYEINKDGSVTFNEDISLVRSSENMGLTCIPFPIKEVKGKFECALFDIEDYANLPERCAKLDLALNSKSVMENKTFEIYDDFVMGSSAIIYGGCPKKFKNVEFKFTGKINKNANIEFVSLSDNMIKGIQLSGFATVELRTTYTKLSADKINKYKDHFKDVIEIKPQWPRNGDVKLVRDSVFGDFYALWWSQVARGWRRF